MKFLTAIVSKQAERIKCLVSYSSLLKKTNSAAEWERVDMQDYKWNDKDQIRRNALWNAFGNLVYLGLQWLITIFVVRIGGYVDAGYLSLALSVSGTFQNVSHFGIRNYQVSDITQKYTDGDYISVRLITCFISILLCFGFLCFSSYCWMQAISIFCFMLFRVVESISDVFQGIAQKYGKLEIAGKSFLLRGIFGFIIFCLTYIITRQLWISILMMTFISALSIVIYDISAVKALKWNKNRMFLHQTQMVKECFPLCIYMLIFAAILTVPRLFLEYLLGTEKLGIYASVFSPALLVQAGVGYFYFPLISVFTEQFQKKDGTGFWHLFVKMSSIMGVGFIGILAMGSFIGNNLLLLFIGEKIRGYEYLFQGILICTILTAYTNFLCAILTILRELKLLVIATSIAFLCCLIISSALIQNYGIQGTSYALIIPLILLLGTLCIVIKKKVSVMNI